MISRRFTMSLVCLLMSSVLDSPALSSPSAPDQTVFNPRRVVSLYPTASEVLAAIGRADLVAGITWHDQLLPGMGDKIVVGGFAGPDLERILAIEPDLVIANPLHGSLIDELEARKIPVLVMDAVTLAEGEENIRILGRLAQREEQAEQLIASQRAMMETASTKAERMKADPKHRPLRAMRLMGFADGKMLVPGDDSFQNELIRMAGGDAPVFGQKGGFITITPQQWRDFDPEFVYYCGHDPQKVRDILSSEEWAGSAALRTDKLYAYPCDPICRVATQHGLAALTIGADLYGEVYSRKELQIHKDEVLKRESLDLSYPVIASAEVLDSRIFDMPARSFLLRFRSPQTVLSTLTGLHSGVMAVGNHSSPVCSWPITAFLGMDAVNTRVKSLFGVEEKSSVFLHTGADVGHRGTAHYESDGIRVTAVVTVGVESNAMRAGTDLGLYVEPALPEPAKPGTINVILISNRKLSQPAMARMIIAATEAKSAALQDIDVRSSYTHGAATGTGTDNVLVISGEGAPATMSGGHTKLGELTARAVYDAVKQSLAKHNRLTAKRHIFHRLREYGVSPVVEPREGMDRKAALDLSLKLERLLLEPEYAAFVEMALPLSDSDSRGLIHSEKTFQTCCLAMAGRIAGKHVDDLEPVFTDPGMPRVLRDALNALCTGILRK